MDKVYDHKKVEERIYKDWEEKGYFSPEINPNGKPYSIILPPPNANAPLHFGHAMYVIEDILIRYHRMKGCKTLWLPGADHAGFETQFVFEKKLQEEGKSRFDYDRETLYKMIWDFVQGNRPIMEDQLRRLGFSLDWTRKKFTLDEDIKKIVYETFKKLYNDGFLYRDKRLVNYCTHDGTSFSDLEVIYKEKDASLYFIKYPLARGKGFITVATTRPETMLGDTAVAVNPKDKRYKELIGKFLSLPFTERQIPVVEDSAVDMEFGTGAVKITPAHDFNDFELAKRHNLQMVQVIGFDGKMNKKAGMFVGMYAKAARKAVIEEMKKKGLVEKINENYVHRIGLCYKCKNPIEPLPLEQWFVKMRPLASSAIKAIKDNKIKFYPQRHKKTILQFLENIKDWNISRQIAWGIRIPAWSCQDCKNWIVTKEEKPKQCKCGSGILKQDTDTFDTWFSSSQWPFATLMTNKKEDLKSFYPNSVMETMYDILLFWVARMIMVGIYKTGNIPFREVVLHGMVKDPLGKKMSKSKGNVVDPLEIVDKYGADAVRFALVYGTAFGNDQSLSFPKLQAMRNFTNKLWNIGRFIEMQFSLEYFKEKNLSFYSKEMDKNLLKEDQAIINATNQLIKKTTSSIDSYRFHDSAAQLYEFIWHKLADIYVEQIKERLKNGDENALIVLRHVWIMSLKLLHPFMPFITEELWNKIPRITKTELIISKWPK
ncbi:MAG: valine--tRNA ligase [Candidatus Levybacteria bacterium RBG_16_35_11]|nr:MAG: valine--tRNA ligase [Candidatus Levybacteria bacterium RBG_16_35_11]